MAMKEKKKRSKNSCKRLIDVRFCSSADSKTFFVICQMRERENHKSAFKNDVEQCLSFVVSESVQVIISFAKNQSL
jgi:hypothetical protein